jgi:hypothetical protein
MLLDDAAGDADERALAAELEAASGGAAVEAAPAKPKAVDCPHCGEPNPARAHRCTACGRPIRDLVTAEERTAHARFRLWARAGVALGVLAAGIIVLGLAIVSGGTGGARPKNIEWSKLRWADVEALFGPASKLGDEKRRELWQRSYAGKWIRWEGQVAEVEPAGLFGEGSLLVRSGDGPGDAGVRVHLPRAELAKSGVAAGATVTFTGRLRAAGGDGVIEVSDGQVVAVKR